MNTGIKEINEFLLCQTPKAWLVAALQQVDLLLIDHAHCEKKAASSALSLIYRYVDKSELLQKMSRLAREELRHFETVLKLMQQRGIEFIHLESCGYAEGLRRHVRTHEPYRLIDQLIVAAFIEARSCERFHALAPHLDKELSAFYEGLLAAEARHFKDYLQLAERYSEEPIGARVEFFAKMEAGLILGEDKVFRFHSGGIMES